MFVNGWIVTQTSCPYVLLAPLEQLILIRPYSGEKKANWFKPFPKNLDICCQEMGFKSCRQNAFENGGPRWRSLKRFPKLSAARTFVAIFAESFKQTVLCEKSVYQPSQIS